MLLQQVFVVLLLTFLVEAESNYKLGDALKNNTSSFLNNNSSGDVEDNVLRIEARKYLRDCGGQDNENDYSGNSHKTNRRGVQMGTRRKSQYDEDDSQENSNNNNKRKRYNDRRYNRNRGRPSNYGQDSSQEDSESSQDSSEESTFANNRRKDTRNKYYGNNNRNNRDECEDDDRNNRNGPSSSYNPWRPGQNTYRGNGYSYSRSTRSNKNYDNQCVSQCVFGYLEMLDDNRVPSETLLIKFLQEHFNSNDMKRIKALRDARRCFARLATSDTEDGCDFSQTLSKCLNLDLN